MSRIEAIGNATLYLGDATEILPGLRRPDVICSDPPYGQGLRTNSHMKASGRAMQRTQIRGGKESLIKSRPRLYPDGILGDDRPFDPDWLLAAADRLLLWGAHKFGHRLPRGRWLGWDKVPSGKVRDQGDGELAWTNVGPERAFRLYRLLWDGLCVGPAARHEVTAGPQRYHPTQKPESLMAWCLTFLDLKPGDVVCDPYMGAGSTGMAALKLGHPFVGIELEPNYFDFACRRIEDAQRQMRLAV